jgi:hypothetical protein
MTGFVMAGCEPPLLRTYYPNGKLKSLYTIENGKIHGTYTEYFQNGAIKEERAYEHGELTGVFRQYNEDGGVTMETQYLGGLKNGSSIHYHHNGKRFNISNFKSGIKVGEESQFDSSGACTGRSLFDSAGNLLFHQALFPQRYSRVHPIVRVDSHTVDIGKHCKMIVSFGYDLHGEVAFKVESLDTSEPPFAKVDADTIQDHYRLSLHFKQAGLHKVRVTIMHHQLSGDTLTADGITKDLQLMVSDEHTTEI